MVPARLTRRAGRTACPAAPRAGWPPSGNQIHFSGPTRDQLTAIVGRVGFFLGLAGLDHVAFAETLRPGNWDAAGPSPHNWRASVFTSASHLG